MIYSLSNLGQTCFILILWFLDTQEFLQVVYNTKNQGEKRVSDKS